MEPGKNVSWSNLWLERPTNVNTFLSLEVCDVSEEREERMLERSHVSEAVVDSIYFSPFSFPFSIRLK